MSDILNKKYHIAIIGGGASGLAAAIAAKKTATADLSVAVFERQLRVGKKLIATGNGRCNYTNVSTKAENYNFSAREFAKIALSKFTPENNISFFEKLGIYPDYEENGKVYPYSHQSSSFVDVLRFSAENLGIEIITQTEVQAVKPHGIYFKVATDMGNFEAKKVIFATGGMASPDLGGTVKGYNLARSMGHSVGDLSPALVQIKTENDLPKSLKGIKFWGNATLKSADKILGEEQGEILFAEYGLSGLPILQLSCYLVGQPLGDVWVFLDFFPKISKNELIEILKERQKLLGHLTLENYFTGFMNKKTAQLLLKRILDRQLSFKVEDLSTEDIFRIASGVKGFKLAVQGVTGWKNAQVTAGGVATAEVFNESMESKIVQGIYFCGELLDVNGDCGGFNLQWAWSSGRLSGESAVKALGMEND
ncbi:MAG: aminoacetone oxidase family FAD-binding enzyme [Clostridiales bacterium]